MIELEIDDLHLCPLCGCAVRKPEMIQIVGNGAFAMLAHKDCADRDSARPTKPQAPEWVDGLPPKGADLEYDTSFGNWCPAKCIARGHDHDDAVAVIQTTNRMFIVSDTDKVRLRRTKEQRERDELAVTMWSCIGGGKARAYEIADEVIAAGWRKGGQ